jgi:hypothetical protein
MENSQHAFGEGKSKEKKNSMRIFLNVTVGGEKRGEGGDGDVMAVCRRFTMRHLR